MGFRSRKSRKSSKKKNKTKRGGTLAWNAGRQEIEATSRSRDVRRVERAEANVLNLIFGLGNPFGEYWRLTDPRRAGAGRVELNSIFWTALANNLTLAQFINSAGRSGIGITIPASDPPVPTGLRVVQIIADIANGRGNENFKYDLCAQLERLVSLLRQRAALNQMISNATMTQRQRIEDRLRALPRNTMINAQTLLAGLRVEHGVEPIRGLGMRSVDGAGNMVSHGDTYYSPNPMTMAGEQMRENWLQQLDTAYPYGARYSNIWYAAESHDAFNRIALAGAEALLNALRCTEEEIAQGRARAAARARAHASSSSSSRGGPSSSSASTSRGGPSSTSTSTSRGGPSSTSTSKPRATIKKNRSKSRKGKALMTGGKRTRKR